MLCLKTYFALKLIQHLSAAYTDWQSHFFSVPYTTLYRIKSHDCCIKASVTHRISTSKAVVPISSFPLTLLPATALHFSHGSQCPESQFDRFCLRIWLLRFRPSLKRITSYVTVFILSSPYADPRPHYVNKSL